MCVTIIHYIFLFLPIWNQIELCRNHIDLFALKPKWKWTWETVRNLCICDDPEDLSPWGYSLVKSYQHKCRSNSWPVDASVRESASDLLTVITFSRYHCSRSLQFTHSLAVSDRLEIMWNVESLTDDVCICFYKQQLSNHQTKIEYRCFAPSMKPNWKRSSVQRNDQN